MVQIKHTSQVSAKAMAPAVSRIRPWEAQVKCFQAATVAKASWFQKLGAELKVRKKFIAGKLHLKKDKLG